MTLPDTEDLVVTLRSFIATEKLNALLIKDDQKNFYDINLLSANHPILYL